MFPTHDRTKTKYIGREEELSLLSGLLDEVRKGKGKLVLVEGEAGIERGRLQIVIGGTPGQSIAAGRNIGVDKERNR